MGGTGRASFLAADFRFAAGAGAFGASAAATGFSLGAVLPALVFGFAASAGLVFNLAATAALRSRMDLATALTVFFNDDLSDFIYAFRGKMADSGAFCAVNTKAARKRAQFKRLLPRRPAVFCFSRSCNPSNKMGLKILASGPD